MTAPAPLLDALATAALLADGAMGTELHARGMPYSQCFEALCLTQPPLVLEVHRAYARAGARLLQTNTFGANRYRLAAHGLAQEVASLNRAAVELAREAAPNALAVGSVGPTGLAFASPTSRDCEAIRGAFEQQVRALHDAGVDALVLETMRHPLELRLALEAAAAQSDRPVIALVTFDPGGVMADGTTPERIAELLAAWGASVSGANCCDGPDTVLAMVARMGAPGLPLAARPNAGLPLEGRHPVGPEEFASYVPRFLAANVRLLGGCCGTSPAHLARAGSTLRQLGHLQ